ncbi:MAG: exodeoxyribonuclease VII small subunit [Clostridium sp.]|nr:exodeoxyribonuclease VII small subunit [Clostridium sp.]
MEEKNEEKAFQLEEAFDKLEETVLALEQEDISLEESFQIYKSGMELLKLCSEAIDTVEKKVQVLGGNGETYEF